MDYFKQVQLLIQLSYRFANLGRLAGIWIAHPQL